MVVDRFGGRSYIGNLCRRNLNWSFLWFYFPAPTLHNCHILGKKVCNACMYDVVQGNDIGTQYRSGIYFYSEAQAILARESMELKQKEIKDKIVTEILPAKTFYRAEEYHQQYLEKGGGRGLKQSARKGCNDPIRCYGWCEQVCHMLNLSCFFLSLCQGKDGLLSLFRIKHAVSSSLYCSSA